MGLIILLLICGAIASSKRRTATPAQQQRAAWLLILISIGVGTCYFTNGFNGSVKEFYTPPKESRQRKDDEGNPSGKDALTTVVNTPETMSSLAEASFDPITLKRGQTIVIKDRTNLYFRDQFYRLALPGEEFQVYEYRPDEKKLYILSKDASGNTIGLNITDQSSWQTER